MLNVRHDFSTLIAKIWVKKFFSKNLGWFNFVGKFQLCVGCAFGVLEAGWLGRADSILRQDQTVISTKFDFASYDFLSSLNKHVIGSKL